MNVQTHDAAQRTSSDATNNSKSILSNSDSSRFMQMLITELQAQDPMSPMDTSAMVTQLTQLNTLDQVTQIRELLQDTTGLNISKS